MSEDDDGEDWTGPFIHELVRTKLDGLVTAYMIFATYIDSEGRTCYWGDTLEGQTAATSLGLIGAMDAIERHRIVAEHFGSE